MVGEGSDEVSACEGGTGPKDSSDAKVKISRTRGQRGLGRIIIIMNDAVAGSSSRSSRSSCNNRKRVLRTFTLVPVHAAWQALPQCKMYKYLPPTVTPSNVTDDA